MGKTRDFFKKIRDILGNISCKDGLNKGQKWYGPKRSRRLLVTTSEMTQNIQDTQETDRTPLWPEEQNWAKN